MSTESINGASKLQETLCYKIDEIEFNTAQEKHNGRFGTQG